MSPEAELPVQEPVAVIGMSCRLPGAADPVSFWDLLRSGTDAVTEVPAGRWPDRSGSGQGDHPARGGFLPDIDRFDADFFGISPLEAAATDPQQRLTLELAWEAVEQARIDPSTLEATPTGVFVGAITGDYALLHDRLGTGAVGPHTLTGVHRGMIANRVSYALGLRGPSLTVDSGQSSSLLAVQLACESLRRGDARTALAGGVNLNLVPETSDMIAGFGGLSPDGRCHTFDHRANGYVRGEGGALVVLKTLSAALADGDEVHCLILGGAVNNDGGGDGLTVPRAQAQEDVVRQAARHAGVAPADVQYVELHGTGTRVGDPVEAAALGAALGADRPRDAPLLVGSVKTNIGHLEGAAGVAGLLKVILGLVHRQLPPSLHFTAPPPDIPLDALGLRVVTSSRDWPRPDKRLVAGVSSWGMGGSNCHLVLAEAPPRDAAPRPVPPAAGAPWVLTARTPDALRARAEDLAGHLAAHPSAEPADVALSLVRTRTRFEHRAVLLGSGRDELTAAARALHSQEPAASVVTGRAGAGGPTAFVFPGQGSQWQGMARRLMDESAVFADRIAECADALRPFTDFALLDVLRETPGAPDPGRNDVTQTSLWAVMVSLAEVWRHAGVTPDLVIGHSQGEIAAATVTGALRLEDGARVVALRSRALNALRGGGMMSVRGASEAAVERTLRSVDGVTVAAVNGPGSIVVSGATDRLDLLRGLLEADGCRVRTIPVVYASHSAAVDAIRDELLSLLAPVAPRSVPTLFVSTLTGEPMDTAGLDADYWFRSLRHPVRFADATRHALDLDTRLFVECSPHPVLVPAIEETAEETGREVAAVGTLRRDEGGEQRVLRSLAEAFVQGADVDWRTRCDVPGARLTDLPTYAFQRRRHWLGAGPAGALADRPAAAGTGVPAPAAEPDRVAGPAGTSRRACLRLVTATAAALLGHSGAEAVDAERTFKDLGLNSIGAVELRNRLRTATGLSLPTGLVYAFPTPRALAGHLHSRLGGTGGDRDDAADSAPDRADHASEPIAIVAMGCRFPGGVETPDDLWRLLADGADVISPFPADRGWDLDALLPDGGPEGSARCVTGHGGFLRGADTFDASFFGISPREARGMDPQQRLLLETSWEAVERAGLAPEGLRGSDTGVFIGAMAAEYGPRLHEPAGASEGLMLTGNGLSVASGRIAYTFGLRGPALTVDTACSSSLVAVQLAVRSLRTGECSLALAGGVTVMSGPGNLVEFSRQNGLAPDGRAKAFADGADGTAFAEGAGVLLLERLSDARRAGHPVLAVIRGAAVNQDGASNGLTAPNGEAQQDVIRGALADARLEPYDVDAVEAHGTGTSLGDPIEAEALQAVYGHRRTPERPVWLGSVKSNLGHTQAAAGVAGVIKMVLALRHGTLPRTLHVDRPTPKIDWDAGGLRLLTESRDWPAAGRPARAAVSSFGISGTNAHLILEAAPPTGEPAPDPSAGGPLVWPLSARTASSLAAGAERLHRHANRAPEPELRATGPLLARRPAFAHRATVIADSRDELCAALAALAEDRPHAAVSRGVAPVGTRTVFVLPGRAPDWAASSAELLRTDTAFADRLRSCDAVLTPVTGWSTADVLLGTPGAPGPETPDVAGPAWFAVQCALAAVWRAAGIEPSAVLAAGAAETAAAHVAGVLTLADAVRLVATGRLPDGASVRPTDTEVWSADTGTLVTPEDLTRRDRTAPPAGPDPLGRALGALDGTGRSLYVELSPAPRSAADIEAVLGRRDGDARTARVVPYGGHGDAPRFVAAAAAAHARGADVSWSALLGPASRHVELPTYAFDRKRFWLSAPARAAVAQSPRHPLIDSVVPVADTGGHLLTGELTATTALRRHGDAAGRNTLVPGTAVLDLALRAARAAGLSRVEELTLTEPLPLPLDGDPATWVQTTVRGADEDGRREVTVHSRPSAGRAEEWTLHATGLLGPDTGPEPEVLPAGPPQGATRIDPASFPADGPGHGIEAAWRDGTGVYAEIGLPAPGPDAGTPSAQARADDALHVLAFLAGAENPPSGGEPPAHGSVARMPFRWSGVRTASGPTGTTLRARLTGQPDGTCAVALHDADGRWIAGADAVTLRPLATGDGTGWARDPEPAPAPTPSEAAPPPRDGEGAPAAAAWTGPLGARLGVLDARGRRDFLVHLVREQVATVLEHDTVDDVDPDRAFNDLGVNSLAALELEEMLLEETGLRLPSTVVFDHPSVHALADYLLGRLRPPELRTPAGQAGTAADTGGSRHGDAPVDADTFEYTDHRL
ncbi:type I polyketide synthase [Streptomyces sp. NPDC056452]|uniref:type I polyketide synthase n=1 Tax=Streptomyces sp. NPDC056452 TaxID=3345821 RepID=UPI0036B1CC5E